VLDICAFLFTNDVMDYVEELMYLMRVHVEKVEKMTPPCWFFYQILIYFITGIPNTLWNQIQTLPLPEPNKQIFASIRDGDNIEYLEYVAPVLRNYLGKTAQILPTQKEEFKTNFVHLLFYLVGYVYKSTTVEDDIPFSWATILLVYLFETFPPEVTKLALISSWNIAKLNLQKGKAVSLKQVTCQLLCVMVWRHSLEFLGALVKDQKLHILIRQIRYVAKRLEEYQERKRAILGTSTLI
jgi:hypothetical protein